MRVLKIFGTVLLAVMGVGAIGQLLRGILAVVVIVHNSSSGNLSYVLGQITGSVIMLALTIAGIKALRKSLRSNSSDEQGP